MDITPKEKKSVILKRIKLWRFVESCLVKQWKIEQTANLVAQYHKITESLELEDFFKGHPV